MNAPRDLYDIARHKTTPRHLAEYRAKHEARFVLRNAGGLFLHWSGAKLTDERKHAWIGYRSQAANIQAAIALAAGLRLEDAR